MDYYEGAQVKHCKHQAKLCVCMPDKHHSGGAVLQRNEKQIEGIRRACRLGREILDTAHRIIRPGITTDEIDKAVSSSSDAFFALCCPHFFSLACMVSYCKCSWHVCFIETHLHSEMLEVFCNS